MKKKKGNNAGRDIIRELAEADEFFGVAVMKTGEKVTMSGFTESSSMFRGMMFRALEDGVAALKKEMLSTVPEGFEEISDAAWLAWLEKQKREAKR